MGEGNSQSGDLILKVQIKPHNYFKREEYGNNKIIYLFNNYFSFISDIFCDAYVTISQVNFPTKY